MSRSLTESTSLRRESGGISPYTRQLTFMFAKNYLPAKSQNIYGETQHAVVLASL